MNFAFNGDTIVYVSIPLLLNPPLLHEFESWKVFWKVLSLFLVSLSDFPGPDKAKDNREGLVSVAGATVLSVFYQLEP